MKIAFLHRNLPPDSLTGVATQVDRLATALTRLGESVHVFTLSKSTSRPYEVHTLHAPRLESAAACMPFLKRVILPWAFSRIDFRPYDLVHVHGDGLFLPYGASARPVWVRTFYGSALYERRYGKGPKSWLAQSWSWYGERREGRLCPHQAAIAEHVRHALPTVTRVIPCMLDGPPPDRPPLKAPRPTLIHVGSLHGRKRGSMALALWQTLRERGQSWRLHLVCPASEAQDLKAADLGPDLLVHSGVSDAQLRDLYAESWVALSLAAYEGFGLPLIEAMAQGCLPLSVPHLGAVDLLARVRPESLCEPDRMPMRLEAWLKKGFNPDDHAIELMRIAEAFSPARIARQYLAWYHELTPKVPA